MNLQRCLPFVSFVALFASAPLPSVAVGQDRPDRFHGMEARAIGPAGMSGRVSDVEVVLRDRATMFVGASTGGVFRSPDGGLTWEPVFDDQPVLGVGAVAVFQPNPDIVWAGTGEGNPRNSAGVGRGIFKSIDGGDSWTFMGLGDSERIHRVLTHPSNPDLVYVGAMGPAWSDGEERGVFRTQDGGTTWERVLWENERTGIAELVMDPSNPDRLLAAMWEFRREPWYLTSGGPGSGIFLTEDGGDTWRRLTSDDGLPPGELGRIGLAFASSRPDVVYALVEATRSALLRSDDGGLTWRTINDDPGVNPRPFYYADLRVDPRNENRVYRLHSAVQVSEDAGRTFRTVVPSAIIHGDIHELWIDPDDPSKMILGEDGGIAFTYNQGDTWRFVENLPLAQFYHITVDDAVPFNVYGGLQDNGSWFGPSTVWENKGILNAHWTRVGGGDGFSVMPDRSDPERFGYSQSQGGNLQHFDKLTGARRSIRPVHPDGVELRFNWNAGLTWDPFDPGVIYLGSQFVHRSPDQGRTWSVISPDLTTNDPDKQRAFESGGLTVDASGAEMHTTILSISPSALEEGLMWVGTDDGNVQVTRDGGHTWTNVRDRIPNLPEGIWVPDVQPSRHSAGRAYAVAEDHRRGDWTPRIYVTEDYGESWSALATEGIGGFVHAIEEDPENPDLLFLGTEFGLRVSLDRGRSWETFRAGVPAVPIRDLVVHPRDGDLVLGTHGRAVLIVDDVRPLRELASDAAIATRAVHAFPPPPALDVQVAEAIGYRSTGHAMQQGETRPVGALLSFWTNGGGAVDLEITGAGSLVYSTRVQAREGVNRHHWDLRPGGQADEDEHPRQITVAPGEYQVVFRRGDVRSETILTVRPDPRDPVSAADRMAMVQALRSANRLVRETNQARDRLGELMERLDMVLETLGEDEALVTTGRDLRARAASLMEEHFTGPECQGLCRGNPTAAVVGRPLGRIVGDQGPPSGNTLVMIEQAQGAAEVVAREVNALLDGPVARYREALIAAGYSPLDIP